MKQNIVWKLEENWQFSCFYNKKVFVTISKYWINAYDTEEYNKGIQTCNRPSMSVQLLTARATDMSSRYSSNIFIFIKPFSSWVQFDESEIFGLHHFTFSNNDNDQISLLLSS